MFFYDCNVTLESDTLYFNDCSFKYIAYHTSPPFTLAVSPDTLIEIINKMDEETQLREIKAIYALPTSSDEILMPPYKNIKSQP